MTWMVAAGAGAGLGLAYFGGLWLTVRRVVSRRCGAAWIPLSSATRLLLLGLGFLFLSRQGAGAVLAALGGLWLSRAWLLRHVGGLRYGR
jgi:F1F0 ATPase subunit 2